MLGLCGVLGWVGRRLRVPPVRVPCVALEGGLAWWWRLRGRRFCGGWGWRGGNWCRGWTSGRAP